MVILKRIIFINSKPIDAERENINRWSRGGGIEQPCQYIVYYGALLYEQLMVNLEEIMADCEVGAHYKTNKHLLVFDSLCGKLY